MAFLAAFGAFPVIMTGAATGAATGTTTGTITGTAIGTADPEAAGAVVCAKATAKRATKRKRDLNILKNYFLQKEIVNLTVGCFPGNPNRESACRV